MEGVAHFLTAVILFLFRLVFTHGWKFAVAVIAVIVFIRLFWIFNLGGHAIRRNRARTLVWRVKLHLRPSPGYATTVNLLWHWSRFAAVNFTARTRPDMPYLMRLIAPSTNYAARLGRAQYFKRVWANPEDQTVYIAPPRTAKSTTLADRGLYHPGPWLNTTTRDDIARLTGGIRAEIGPVYVFNPQRVGRYPSNFAWSPIVGCIDPEVALRRAKHCMGPTGTGDMAFWQAKGTAALAALFHAADILRLQGFDCDVTTVWAWINRQSEDLVKRALTSPEATKSMIAAFLEIARDTRQADSVRITMSEAMQWVLFPDLMALTTGPAASAFDFHAFLRESGTMYLIAKGGDDSACASLFRMFVGEMHYEAGLYGSRSPFGKLVPPLLMSLDEVSQICQVPLDKWLADSAGWGVQLEYVIHDYAQLEAVWGMYEAKVMWGLTGTKIILPGLQNPETCERLSTMIGRVNVMKDDAEGVVENVQVAPAEFIRQLPDWRALVIRRNRPATVVQVRPIFRRLRYRADRWLRWPLVRWTLRAVSLGSLAGPMRRVAIPQLRVAAIAPGVTAVLPVAPSDDMQVSASQPAPLPVTPGDGPEAASEPPGAVQDDSDPLTIPPEWMNDN